MNVRTGVFLAERLFLIPPAAKFEYEQTRRHAVVSSGGHNVSNSADNNDRIELQHRLEQARRLSDDATDPTTRARLAVLILSLEADLHHDELRRRSK